MDAIADTFYLAFHTSPLLSGIALEMGVPEACKYFMKVTAAGLSTSDAAAYLISEKGVSKMTVAQALCTAETMDPKFGAVQGHP